MHKTSSKHRHAAAWRRTQVMARSEYLDSSQANLLFPLIYILLVSFSTLNYYLYLYSFIILNVPVFFLGFSFLTMQFLY